MPTDIAAVGSGVPVRRTRCRDSYCSKVALSLEAAFFMRCPSSMMMYSYRIFLSRCLSFMMSSYVVTITLNGGVPSTKPAIEPSASSWSKISRRTSGAPL